MPDTVLGSQTLRRQKRDLAPDIRNLKEVLKYQGTDNNILISYTDNNMLIRRAMIKEV